MFCSGASQNDSLLVEQYKENSLQTPTSTHDTLLFTPSSPLTAANILVATSTSPRLNGQLTPTRQLTDFDTPLHIDTRLPDDMLASAGVPPTPTESSISDVGCSTTKKLQESSISPARKCRFRCKCGAESCRKWLY